MLLKRGRSGVWLHDGVLALGYNLSHLYTTSCHLAVLATSSLHEHHIALHLLVLALGCNLSHLYTT